MTTHNAVNPNFEQRVQTIIQVVICSVLIWGGNSLLSVREGLLTLQATTVITNAQTTKDISDLKAGLESVKSQGVATATAAANATSAATAATTAATTAAAVAATAVSTAAALAAGDPKKKK
jgi:hypothetical protein